MAMDTIIKKDWTDALRSGEYYQATGSLEAVVEDATPGELNEPRKGFCCLGVLATVLSEKHPKVLEKAGVGVDTTFDNLTLTTSNDDWDLDPEDYEDGEVPRFSYHDAELPTELLGELGLTHEEEQKLINLNDNEGLPFTKIADFIEDNL